ncbi:hypothetical protein QJ854_gp968 [Moumouvirus goulette]|uniref:Uncharacterized protein n=1 Tax=Moumouvirus goulette TaxID=1247379 RepID=M1PAB3_9VIRU|nr:hypothetical protein QJ854_gp968 [Moumouvirus goulette]AGF84814.1 hypothetical protein glt_00004 [Moumouvirus goulette]
MDSVDKALVLKYFRKYFKNISDVELNNFDFYFQNQNLYMNKITPTDRLMSINNILSGGNENETNALMFFYNKVLRD